MQQSQAGAEMDSKERVRRLEQIKLAFSNNVRVLRKRKGWTQQDLADRAGMHRTTVVRIETGIHLPLWSEGCLLCDLLGVQASEMRGDLGQAD
jgi:DNA-binding XRE family transcriptional regulator